METIVKYRFDREMVAFVKTLDIKTAMFGYDKNDVYSKFKDLLVKARDVCEELVTEECKRLEVMKIQLLEAAEDPEALKELLDEWEREEESKITAPLELDLSPQGEEGPADPVVEEGGDELEQALAEQLEEPAGEEGEDPSQLQMSQILEENQALRARIQELDQRQELLHRAHDIVSEARLEREAIIRKAQSTAEEELFLYRAKRREEEAASKLELDRLAATKEKLEDQHRRYLAYVSEGQTLFNQLRTYAAGLEDLEEAITMSSEDRLLDDREENLDPPVLSLDKGTGCTEEAMPLCELAEDRPEEIFPHPELLEEQADLDNEPVASPDEGEACSEDE